MSIQGVLVTQPSSDETYSMVKIELDGKVVLWLLFRHSDGYLIAFYLVPTDENPGGWYHFSDTWLPFGLEGSKLGWDCGYSKQVGITIGKGITLNILECLLAFTPDNCLMKMFTPDISTGDGIYDRVRVLQTCMVLLGECQRSGVFLQFAEHNFESEEALNPLDAELNDHLHRWSVVGRSVLDLYLALLKKKYGVNGWEEELNRVVERMGNTVKSLSSKHGHGLIKEYIIYEQGANGVMVPNYPRSMTRLVGSSADSLLHLINYDPDLVTDILMTMKKHGQSYSEVDVRED